MRISIDVRIQIIITRIEKDQIKMVRSLLTKDTFKSVQVSLIEDGSLTPDANHSQQPFDF